MKPIISTFKMNSLETEYSYLLDLQKCNNEILDWRFEGIRFKLGDGAYYKPDFLIVKKDRFEIHETKGHWREAAKVRIKTAATLYPWFKFVAVYQNKKPKRWVFEEF